eukprot:jgi/Bigna1/141600/aug1.63_g16308
MEAKKEGTPRSDSTPSTNKKLVSITIPEENADCKNEITVNYDESHHNQRTDARFEDTDKLESRDSKVGTPNEFKSPNGRSTSFKSPMFTSPALKRRHSYTNEAKRILARLFVAEVLELQSLKVRFRKLTRDGCMSPGTYRAKSNAAASAFDLKYAKALSEVKQELKKTGKCDSAKAKCAKRILLWKMTDSIESFSNNENNDD